MKPLGSIMAPTKKPYSPSPSNEQHQVPMIYNQHFSPTYFHNTGQANAYYNDQLLFDPMFGSMQQHPFPMTPLPAMTPQAMMQPVKLEPPDQLEVVPVNMYHSRKPDTSDRISQGKKRPASPEDLKNSPQISPRPIPQLDGFMGDDEVLITVQIPERKGEKMIFYLKLLKDNHIYDLNKEVDSMPTLPNQPGLWLTAALYADFKTNEGETQKIKLSKEEQVRRADPSFVFKNGQATVHLNIPVTRRSLSSQYSNLVKPARIYVLIEMFLGDKRIACSDYAELPYKDGKVKRAWKKGHDRSPKHKQPVSDDQTTGKR